MCFLLWWKHLFQYPTQLQNWLLMQVEQYESLQDDLCKFDFSLRWVRSRCLRASGRSDSSKGAGRGSSVGSKLLKLHRKSGKCVTIFSQALLKVNLCLHNSFAGDTNVNVLKYIVLDSERQLNDYLLVRWNPTNTRRTNEDYIPPLTLLFHALHGTTL